MLIVSCTYTSGPLHASVQTAVNALTYNIPTYVAVQTGVNALTYVSGLLLLGQLRIGVEHLRNCPSHALVQTGVNALTCNIPSQA